MADIYRRHQRRRGWARLRFQVVGTLLIAAVLPFLIRYPMVSDPILVVNLQVTLIANLLTVAVGIWLFRSVSNYPGVEASSYIIPSFSIAYALAVLVLLLGRFEYNRALLIAGFGGSIVSSYLIYSRMQRRRLKIGYVAIGAACSLAEHRKIDWIPLVAADASITGLDAVAVDLRTDLPEAWERRLADFALAGLPVYHWKHLTESLSGRVELEHLSENNFGSLTPASAYMSIKYAADWVAAAIALVVLAPFLLLLAIAIRLGSPGPAIFRQERIGYQGRIFTVFKFRTMTVVPVGENARASAMTQTNDQRVTALGQILRRTRIDELPQLANVLLGEMSWIGPRPEAEVLSKWYEDEIAFYRYRHIVRPGITGWAQVNQGHVAEVDDVRAKLAYDFFYIRNFSPWIDLLIVARTAATMFTGFGSR